MAAQTLHTDLMRVIHELWRARLGEEGWQLGAYRPQDKLHDALVPFEQLSEGDRLALCTYIRSEELEERLTAELSYPRGPDRPLLLHEMTEGLPVAFCAKGCPKRVTDVPEGMRGTVVRWEVQPCGELGLITVRWGDGQESQYDPWERELARIAELG